MPNPQSASINGSQPRKHFFVTIIKIDLAFQKPSKELPILLLQLQNMFILRGEILRPTEVYLSPDAFDRIDYQHVAHRIALRDHQTKARKVVFNMLVFAIPRRLVEDTGGIIAFGLSTHSVPRQMVAAQIDPEQCLPVPNSLMPGKGHLPSGTTIKFGKQ